MGTIFSFKAAKSMNFLFSCIQFSLGLLQKGVNGQLFHCFEHKYYHVTCPGWICWQSWRVLMSMDPLLPLLKAQRGFVVLFPPRTSSPQRQRHCACSRGDISWDTVTLCHVSVVRTNSHWTFVNSFSMCIFPHPPQQ